MTERRHGDVRSTPVGVGETRERIELPKLTPAIEPLELVRSRARGRIRLVSFVLCTLLAAVGVRGAALCVLPSARTLQAAAAQRWDQVTLRARRGDVLDRSGRRLATSVATPNVVVDPYRIDPTEVDELARRVAEILGASPEEMAERMRRSSRYQRLAVRVHPAAARAVEALEHPALWVERDPRRYYPEETLAAHVVGFVDAAGSGREGLEASLDHWLRGESILLQRRRDRSGMDVDDPVWGPAGSTRVNEGMDVHLTLDRTIQRLAERALEGVVERSAPKAVSAIVVDVKTGDILALANAPTFNPNDLAPDPAPRKNHVVQDAIEPGSVMKPFTVAAAVELGVADASTLVDCEMGNWAVGRSRIRDDHPHGVITVRDVLKYSSNIGSAKLAQQLGPERFLATLRAFGFGERTDISLPGEREGVLRKPSHIRPIELATTAYGQGVTSTPLQLAYALAALGNGGVRMRPRLVTRVEDAHGVPEYVQSPSMVTRVVSEDTAKLVVSMMEAVTEDGGTAVRARVPGYRVAGKTGTAQKVDDGKYGAGRIGSFVGLVPAEAPEVAIVVTVDDPTVGSRYGGVIAAPAFAEIASGVMRHRAIPPSVLEPSVLEPGAVGETVAQAAVSAESSSAETRQVETSNLPPLRMSWQGEGWQVPDLTGQSLRDVVATAYPAGLSLSLSGAGAVVSQRPPPGQILPPGGELSLVLR
jgi:cell division protein FtsI (penicillin-binding protein 3)